MAAATSVHVVAVIEPIIQHADWFFPGGDDGLFCVLDGPVTRSLIDENVEGGGMCARDRNQGFTFEAL